MSSVAKIHYFDIIDYIWSDEDKGEYKYLCFRMFPSGEPFWLKADEITRYPNMSCFGIRADRWEQIKKERQERSYAFQFKNPKPVGYKGAYNY